MNSSLWRRGTLATLLGVGVLLVAGPFASTLLAHNQLLKTDPAAQATIKAAPARIQFWFGEKPDMTVPKVVVKGPSGIVDTTVHPVSEKVLAADLLQGQARTGTIHRELADGWRRLTHLQGCV